MIKVLWFSRHEMSTKQRNALGECSILQVNKTINHASELIHEINDCDIIAIVAPIGLQREFIEIAGDKPVIMALNERILTPSPDGGEDKVTFSFVKWERIIKIDVVKEDFDPSSLQ